MPAKKEPPHLVYSKQPSIQKKDPFQTDKLEKKAGDAFEKVIIKYRDELIKRVENEISG